MENKPYTSQVAESTVEHLINDRHKKNQKMQWTREGAHNILQIRAAMASNEWDYIWQETILNALGIAA
jgi:UDP-N-acetylmuramate-alanine ligase